MELIKATIKDVKELLEIEKTATKLKVYSGYFNEKEIKEWLKKEIIFLIKNGSNIIGSISYEIKDKEHAEFSQFVIKPEFQKQGLGKKAMEMLLEKLKNFKRFSLTVHPDNHAVKLYETFGFKIKSRKENYYEDGQPRFLMVKNKN